MAQQITIDIIAETQKLQQGINQANQEVQGLGGQLKGLTSTAAAAASAFVLKEGISFLKQGIDEAKEAKEVMTAATTTFGAGSEALKKITEDATKFGKEIAVDNDEIIKLATSLGSRLPADSKALSAELVNLGFDVEAFTAGAVTAETMTSKLAKALADGELKATDLQKIVPGLDQSVYAMAETMSKAGNNQGALNLLIEEGQKKYGDAAEKNVTASQKFDVALANLKETIGAKLLPIIEKILDKLTLLIEKWDAQPELLKNIELGLLAVIGIGGPFLTFLANAKTALVTLGIVQTQATAATAAGTAATTAATTATGLFSLALRALPILAIISLIVLLVQNWDTVTEVVKKVWDMIVNFVKDAIDKMKDFKDKISNIWNSIKNKISEIVGNIVDAFKSIPSSMLSIGKNIVEGLWNGIKSMTSWIKDKVFAFFGDLVPSWAKSILGIRSPSTVFENIGKNIVQGLSAGLAVPRTIATAISPTAKTTTAPVQVVINAGAGTDPYALGRTVSSAISKYSRVSVRSGTYTAL